MFFELLPQVKPLFHSPMQTQGMMLSKMVAFIVGNANRELRVPCISTI